MRVLTILKTLPLGVALPVMLAASTVKPEDAASNLSAWARWMGVHNVPDWLANPTTDRKVLYSTLLASIGYAFVIWVLPRLRRNSQRQATPSLSVQGAPDLARRAAVDEIYPLLDDAEKLYVRGRQISESFGTELTSGHRDRYVNAIEGFISELGQQLKVIGQKCERYEHIREIGEYLHGAFDRDVSPVFTILSSVITDIKSLPGGSLDGRIVAFLQRPNSTFSNFTQGLNQLGIWVTRSKETFRSMRNAL